MTLEVCNKGGPVNVWAYYYCVCGGGGVALLLCGAHYHLGHYGKGVCIEVGRMVEKQVAKDI